MDERELDRAIDAAANGMMAREPSRALHATVMARVRENVSPAPRRFVWMTAVASLVLCGAIAIALMSRTPTAPISPLPPATQPPVAESPIAQPPVVTDAPVTIVKEAPPTRRSGAARIVMTVASPVWVTPNDVSPIEPIETEPITLSAIEVPQLQREVTVIETLTIEALTIEPLAASND